MRHFSKLRSLQIIDGVLLVFLQLAIALLIWMSLSRVSSDAQQELRGSTQSLQQATTAFHSQLQLENLVDKQRETFDALDEEFFNFAFDPNSDPKNLPRLRSLSQELKQRSQALMQAWPNNADKKLKDDYEETAGIMVGLVDELDGLSPGHWRQLAVDARDTARHARHMMEKIESLDNKTGEQLDKVLQTSIQHTVNSTETMLERLDNIKMTALWGALLLMVILTGSRIYFSGRFKHLTELAQQAQSLAENALKTKARFLATMSHEIRTPMNGVIGMTRLLMNTSMTDKQKEFVESIALSGDHLLTVINDVLDFSKIEAGKLDLKCEALDVRACIEDILNLVSVKAWEKQLRLVYTVDPAVPLFIKGDVVRLRQVLTNLVGNAVKFTAQGEVTICVTVHQQQADDYELAFQIRDTGVGIPSAYLGTIFEQFSRADDKLMRQHEGTGLGLAIARHLVTMMGGQIGVDSTLGVGSCFNFTLKTVRAEGELQPFMQTHVPAIAGKRILLLNNHLVSSQAIQAFCGYWGIMADTVSTAEMAVERCLTEKYDVVLVEHHLADDLPARFAQAIRQYFPPAILPLILIAPLHAQNTTNGALYNVQITQPLTRSHLFDSLLNVWRALPVAEVSVIAPSMLLGDEQPLSILLVEDNPINQMVAAALLEEMAYSSDLAEDGVQAIRALQQRAYDVVFMDMQMPEMDGLEATRRIRADFPPDRQPIIIAMTANAMEGDRQACLDAGMDDYLSKPILPEAVDAMLRRWCLQHRFL